MAIRLRCALNWAFFSLLTLAVVVQSPKAFAGDKYQKAAANEASSSNGQQHEGNVCVGVEIGSHKADSFSCLNAEIKGQVQTSRRQADQTNEVAGTGVNKTPAAINLFNQSAARERLGDAFGHSVYPQRLPQQRSLPFFEAKKR